MKRPKAHIHAARNSLVTADPKTKSIVCPPEFYAMKHRAGFVSPDARLVGVTRFWAANALAVEKPGRRADRLRDEPLRRAPDAHDRRGRGARERHPRRPVL